MIGVLKIGSRASALPVVLMILDGWGIAPLSEGNAIERAKTPNMERLLFDFPSCTLEASGDAVGLPYGEVGNSEVGHLTIGLGRVHYQPLPRINHAIIQKTFFSNPVLLDAMRTVRNNGSRLHLIGLASTGGVHSYLDHLFALLDIARSQGVHRVFVHAITDGRDSPFNSGINFLQRIEQRLALFAEGVIATIAGRFYAMDRDERWDRTEAAFRAIALGQSPHQFRSTQWAVQNFYNSAIYDEMIPPTVLTGEDGRVQSVIEPNDVAIFFNFRPDRMRQITATFISKNFTFFHRGAYQPCTVVTMTEYDPSYSCPVAFPNEPTNWTLAEAVSTNQLRQLHIAETEKYAHVTYFLNGYQESPFLLEDRIVVPSPHISSYSEQPEMASQAIEQAFLEAWKKPEAPALTVMNFANADMVGHTGDFEATRRAVACVDERIGTIAREVLSRNGTLFITADHGNAEEMIDRGTGRKKTSHTANPVPFIAVSAAWRGNGTTVSLSARRPMGGLKDVAPTVLAAMGLVAPPVMIGRDLMSSKEERE